jgi:hypothetical protein
MFYAEVTLLRSNASFKATSAVSVNVQNATGNLLWHNHQQDKHTHKNLEIDYLRVSMCMDKAGIKNKVF